MKINTQAEWALRGSLIALVGGAAFLDKWVGGPTQRIGFLTVVGAGVASTGVLAGCAAYDKQWRHIPSTITVDTYGALALGYFGACSLLQVKDVTSAVSVFYQRNSTAALHSLCAESMDLCAIATIALGLGGGAFAYSKARRDGKTWALQWEQRSQALWASLFNMGEGVGSAIGGMWSAIKESCPLLSRQYRDSAHYSVQYIPQEGWTGKILALDHYAAQTAYYAIWGALHAAAVRASLTLYSLGIVIRVLGSEYQPNAHTYERYLNFFKGGAKRFAERSNRDRLTYFTYLFLGAWLINYAPALRIRVNQLLPITLGIFGANQTIEMWKGRNP